MNRRSFIKMGLLLGVVSRAEALVVFDPSNFSQNILQAIRALQSNINEARQIANQVRQLAYELRNVTKLPYSILEEYREELASLFTLVDSFDGLMQDLTQLHTEFDELYPQFNKEYGPYSGRTISSKLDVATEETRKAVLEATRVGAKILEDLPKTQSQLNRLLESSENAVGILQATQAGNQISATVSGNLTRLSIQLSTIAHAHNSFLMERNSAKSATKKRMDRVMEGLKPSTHPGVPLSSY